VRRIAGSLHRLRLERPLIAAPGDRLVIRCISPPGTAGGGQVVAAYPPGTAPRGRRPQRAAPAPPAHGPPPPASVALPAEALTGAAGALEEVLRAAGHQPPNDRDLDADALRALREAGRAVSVARTMHFHVDALAGVEGRLRTIVEAEGQIDLSRLREELQTSRKYARALLEYFDGAKVTLRRPDDTRVLRRRSR
jgi:selenocysteine-specific elongation factor